MKSWNFRRPQHTPLMHTKVMNPTKKNFVYVYRKAQDTNSCLLESALESAEVSSSSQLRICLTLTVADCLTSPFNSTTTAPTPATVSMEFVKPHYSISIPPKIRFEDRRSVDAGDLKSWIFRLPQPPRRRRDLQSWNFRRRHLAGEERTEKRLEKMKLSPASVTSPEKRVVKIPDWV